jgi:proline iminopeptidase
MTHMQIRDVSLYVKVMGQGYPLALMHGGPSLDHTTLMALQLLADQFTLIFYDHRCNGRSEGAEVSSMTFENLTADADALRQALGFDQWAVLGHSFGGNVALEYALSYLQGLSRLILMNTGGDQWWVNQSATRSAHLWLRPDAAGMDGDGPAGRDPDAHPCFGRTSLPSVSAGTSSHPGR